ncbi:MAG: endonuclease, partial [Caldilineaceae bacterium]|nr:endonuclease [Caldilineaceae bacterium]
MNAIELLYARSVISRRHRTPHQILTFAALVENRAYEKHVEVRWRGEEGDWQTLPARYVATVGENREIWQAEARFKLTEAASLPGNVHFALRCEVGGQEFWANNDGADFLVEADAGVLLGPA